MIYLREHCLYSLFVDLEEMFVTEVPHCWHATSYSSKWQLVHHASESPGEVRL